MGLRIALAALAGAGVILFASAPGWAHPPAQHEPAEEAGAQEQSTSAEPVAEAVVEVGAESEAAPASSDTLADAFEHDHGDEPDPCVDDGHHDAEGGQAGGHSHWGEDGASTPFERSMSRIGVFHSVAVHFPIALILAAALAQVFVLAGRFGSGGDTVRFLVWTGAAGGVAAGLLGWAHSGPMAANEAGVMLAHRYLGTALLFGLVGLAALGEWSRRTGNQLGALLFNIALFGSALALLLNGFLGGALAHGGLRHLIGGG